MLHILILIPEITKGMKSIGSKALLEIKKGVSILEYQIANLPISKIKTHITVATGFEADSIHQILDLLHVHYCFNPLYKETNQAESIRLYLSKYKPKNLLIINNGVLMKQNTISNSILSGTSKLFLLDKEKENFNLGCSISSSATEYIFYDLPQPWAECVYLNESAIINMRSVVCRTQTKQMYLFELLNEMLSNNILLDKHYIKKNNIMKINTIKDISRAKLFI